MTVHYETDGPVAIVTLDRPDVANAIDRPTTDELAALPQAALLSDRLSSYEQWSLPLDEALGVEYRHGMATLETGEMFAGLDDYASGGWRTGAT